jgi:hypothetical protein
VPDTEIKVIERCSGHGGSWGVMKGNFETAIKVGRPVARQALRDKQPFVASECPLAAMHILQGMEIAIDGPRRREGSNAARSERALTRDDIMPIADYGKIRRERRQAISELKKRRRVEVGPFATFYFENYETMWQQVHEMLFVEKGGEAQIADELEAYNPMIPQGERARRHGDARNRRSNAARDVLARLGGIENHVFLEMDGERIAGKPDSSRENTSPDGKASSVQFVWFPFTKQQIERFKAPGTRAVIGFDHRITRTWR